MKFPKVCGRWYGLLNVGKLFPSIVPGGFAFVGEGRGTLRSPALLAVCVVQIFLFRSKFPVTFAQHFSDKILKEEP